MAQTAVLADRAARVLDLLKNLRGMTDHGLAEILGVSHAAVNDRRNGKTRITLADIEKLAGGLNVDPMVFLMEPRDALRWVVENGSDEDFNRLGVAAQSRCTAGAWESGAYGPMLYDQPLPLDLVAA